MDAKYLAELVAYWRDTYDWRAQEAALNWWPQFVAGIDGVDVHFYHIQGDGSQAPPIILTHGWPGSVVEFQAVIPKLVAAGFTVVVPSLPGFGWSGLPSKPIGPASVANMWRTLMVDVLGYSRFFAQGGDWGSAVTVQLAISHDDVVAAIHLNLFMALPPGPDPDAATRRYWAEVLAVRGAEGGYQLEQATKSQTLGLALHDNPVGWASWVVEKFHGWGDTRGDIESRFTKDQLINNLMSYLVTDKVISSLWMYHAGNSEARASEPVKVPTALAKFPGDVFPMPDRTLAGHSFDVVRWTEMPAGGHFAAMEEPELFAEDLIAFFSGRS